jgi:hypothetical protein
LRGGCSKHCWLKAHGVFHDMTPEDLERDLADIDKAQNGKPV